MVIENAGITQLELASRTNLNKDYISNYVKGRIPRANILYRIVEVIASPHAIGTTMAWLLSGDGRDPPPYDPLFAQRLSQALQQSNLTAKALGRDIQLPTTDIIRIVDGYVPDAFTLLRIADRLGVSTRWLLTGENRPHADTSLAFEDGLRLAQQAILQAFDTLLGQKPNPTRNLDPDLDSLFHLAGRLQPNEKVRLVQYMAQMIESREQMPSNILQESSSGYRLDRDKKKDP